MAGCAIEGWEGLQLIMNYYKVPFRNACETHKTIIYESGGRPQIRMPGEMEPIVLGSLSMFLPSTRNYQQRGMFFLEPFYFFISLVRVPTMQVRAHLGGISPRDPATDGQL